MMARALHLAAAMRVLRGVLFAGVLLAACTTTPGPSPSSGSQRCADLEGKTLGSLTPGECGLGPNGPEQCTWHLTFTASDATTTHYSWQHSDYGQEGEVTCAGSDVTEVTTGSDELRGTYDSASGQLVWDGVTYAP
jgi:hypothetical protein